MTPEPSSASAFVDVGAGLFQSPGRVLIVDDDEDFLEVMGAQLRADGHRVRTLADARLALSTVTTFNPDVVLTDLRMPGLTGLELCRLLRADPVNAFLPVILLTHDTSLDVGGAAVEAGVNDFMDKSAPVGVVRLRVRAALRTKRLGDEAVRLLEEQRFLARLADTLSATLREGQLFSRAAEAFSRFDLSALHVVSVTNPDRPVLYDFGPAPVARGSARHLQLLEMAQTALRTNLHCDEVALEYEATDWEPSAERPLISRRLRASPRPLVWIGLEPTRPLSDREVELLDGVIERLAAPVENARLYGQLHAALEERSKAVEQLTQAQASLVHHEKLASIGQLSAGVAHEINNPLAFVISNLNVLREYTRDITHLFERARRGESLEGATLDPDFLISDLGALIEESLDGASRVHGIVKSLKAFAHSSSGGFEEVELGSALESTLNLLGSELRRGALVYRDIHPVPIVRGDRGKMNQVFLNLIVNAMQAIPAGREGRIWIRLFADATDVVFQVEDNGTGIPEHLRQRIFEPFFTTKGQGKGTGLGLPISHDIVRQHGGLLTVDSEEGRGTTFTVRLPARDTRPIPTIQAHSAPEDASAVALFIDDERFLLNAFRRAFSRSAQVLTAQGGEAGIKLLSETPEIDVVFCDLIMGRVSGVEVYRWICTHRPDLSDRFVILTAGATDERFREFIETSRCRIIHKPFTVHEVVETIAEHAQRPRGRRPTSGPLSF